MDFTLHLKVIIRENSNVELTSESGAILALVKYFDIKPNLDFNCFCFYTDSDLYKIDKNISLLENRLNENYPDFHFVNASKGIESKEKCNQILIEKLDSNLNDDYLHETTLPSLVNFISKDSYMIITGLSSVYRFIVKATNKYKPTLKLQSLLGYRSNCLKACSEVSNWTQLCEVTTIKVLNDLNDSTLRKIFFDTIETVLDKPLHLADRNKRAKSLVQLKASEKQRYLEDFMIAISDLLIYFFLSEILFKLDYVKSELALSYPNICKWYLLMQNNEKIYEAFDLRFKQKLLFEDKMGLQKLLDKKLNIDDNFSNSKDFVDTKPDEFENSLHELILSIKCQYSIDLPLSTSEENLYTYEDIKYSWIDVDPLVSPLGGNLPEKRYERKAMQLENFLHIFKNQIYLNKTANKRVVVDFCSGGGHLGIFLAYSFPDCIIKLVENKEESLEIALDRISKLKLKNCFVYKVHCCGSLADLIIEKCLKSKASIIISPCCYGSIKQSESYSYPRSKMFKSSIEKLQEKKDFYSKLKSYADRTEKGIEYEKNAYLCMSLIDSDRLLYLKENNYEFLQLLRMVPFNCSTKNHILLAKISHFD